MITPATTNALHESALDFIKRQLEAAVRSVTMCGGPLDDVVHVIFQN